MKKAVVLIVLTLVMLSSFSACIGEGSAMYVDGNVISAGVYACYLSQTKDADKTAEICKMSAATHFFQYNLYVYVT